MNEDEIKIISGNNYTEIAQILENFIKINDNVFIFPFLLENNRRVSLWAALFQHLQSESSGSIHIVCLSTIKLLR
ncbi:jg8213 [Pararge aegeria aegeria]|uniref:Jg8213 protein n=1 Tax=Pararge aegeria aegeria TaxID=348720 RepID=A0A8S4SIK2_9NEOP|nr:jg8213 [Pararge aegeria aegeria]